MKLSKKTRAFDPEDPMDMEIEAWSDFGIQGITEDELATPHGVQMLIHMRITTLRELKTAQKANKDLQDKYDALRDQKEELRVDVATLRGSAANIWLEIPAGVFAGFAGNILTNDWKSGLGWAFLILGLLMIVGIRGPEIAKWYGETKFKKRPNDDPGKNHPHH